MPVRFKPLWLFGIKIALTTFAMPNLFWGGWDMKIFEAMAREGHEQLIFNYDKTSGLKAIIALHDTRLGPAQGGCRMWNYECEEDAIIDAMRLAKG